MHISEKSTPSFTINDILNPVLWKDTDLRPEVRHKLLMIARNFLETLKVKNLKLRDITISGSNASFNYSNVSDIDLHLIVDIDNPELEDYFNSKKNNYNFKYDLKIKSIPVEVYVQDSKQHHYSAGIYSILDNKWSVKPSREEPNASPQEIKNKARNYSSRIIKVLKSNDIASAQDTLDDIRRLRKAGLEQGGEQSVENLAYKLLRSRGQLDKLFKHIDKLQSAELSLGEQMKIKDILGEDNAITVKGISGDKAELSNGQQIDAKTLTPDQEHPGQLKAPSMDPASIKPGSVVTMGDQTTSESMEDELNKDLIKKGRHNRKVGGDKGDDFITDITDKEFERSARSAMSNNKKLAESDLLYKMLTIAGIK
jgi:predicted nucleotidyltransferase